METYQTQTNFNSYGLAVTDHVSAMLAYWDSDLVCRFANAAYIDWFGIGREEMINKMTLYELLGPLYSANRQYIDGVLAGKPQTFEREIKSPDGRVRHTIVNYFPDVADGKVQGFYTHVADVTAIKLLEKELIQSNEVVTQQNKRLRNFANIVSHNLNTYAFNLESILGFFIEAESEKEKNQMLDYLKAISAGFSSTIKNLNEIVDAQNQGKEKCEWVTLNDYIEKAIGMLSNQVGANHALILNRIDTDIKLYVNPAYLDSIILNLLTNAIKYRHPDRIPLIELTTEINDNELGLKVTDNGLGIDLEKHRKELFGMYKTFHGNADAKGIGLFITRFQAEAAGGHIEVQSEVNKGSTFTVYFPLKSAQVLV
ncbi:MAG TPA: PAS domain-containing sensor histidine kinase [Mucilaginibacter sp.]|jgi:PAS domain S-box-containing protein|nr:PAS domain-containing sensor histidine kinase [Mucilaginibacter sp.]